MGFLNDPLGTGASQGNRDFYRNTEKGRKAQERYEKRAAKQAENDHYPTGIGCSLLAMAMAGGILSALAGLGVGAARLLS